MKITAVASNDEAFPWTILVNDEIFVTELTDDELPEFMKIAARRTRRTRPIARRIGHDDDADNTDHDHDDCVARARAMGVPASWAHTPETYLCM